MQGPESDRIATLLEAAVSGGASSEEVAALVAATFRGIDRALAPIVGERGTAALYERTLHLCRPMHAWLPFAAQQASLDVGALTTALAQRPAAEAASAGARLLESFRTLLDTLIGESLTERLLRPVWATHVSGPAARKLTS